jgi:NACalpha-BTF3-like transcription factor
LNKEDVALIEKEFDVKTDVAERLLREQGGDLQTTIRHLIGLKP